MLARSTLLATLGLLAGQATAQGPLCNDTLMIGVRGLLESGGFGDLQRLKLVAGKTAGPGTNLQLTVDMALLTFVARLQDPQNALNRTSFDTDANCTPADKTGACVEFSLAEAERSFVSVRDIGPNSELAQVPLAADPSKLVVSTRLGTSNEQENSAKAHDTVLAKCTEWAKPAGMYPEWATAPEELVELVACVDPVGAGTPGLVWVDLTDNAASLDMHASLNKAVQHTKDLCASSEMCKGSGASSLQVTVPAVALELPAAPVVGAATHKCGWDKLAAAWPAPLTAQAVCDKLAAGLQTYITRRYTEGFTATKDKLSKDMSDMLAHLLFSSGGASAVSAGPGVYKTGGLVVKNTVAVADAAENCEGVPHDGGLRLEVETNRCPVPLRPRVKAIDPAAPYVSLAVGATKTFAVAAYDADSNLAGGMFKVHRGQQNGESAKIENVAATGECAKMSLNHTFTEAGTFFVEAQAKDSDGRMGSYIWKVTVA